MSQPARPTPWDASPNSPKPPEALIAAAMRDVPPTLADMENTTEYGAGRPPHGERIVLHYRLVQELTQKWQHSKAAAEWAIQRLGEQGMLTIHRGRSFAPGILEWNGAWKESEFSCVMPDLKYSLVQSVPRLWEWWREREQERASASSPQPACEAGVGCTDTSAVELPATLEQLRDWLAERVRWLRDWHLAPDDPKPVAAGLQAAIVQMFRPTSRDFPNNPQDIATWASQQIWRFSEITAHQAHASLERLGILDAPAWPSPDIENDMRALIVALDHLAALLSFIAQRCVALGSDPNVSRLAPTRAVASAAAGHRTAVSVFHMSPLAPLPPEDQPFWEHLRRAFARLVECMRGRPDGRLSQATDFHQQLTETLRGVGMALRAVGLQNCMDDWVCAAGHESYARNLLQFARDPTPEAVGRLLTQDARESEFFDGMRRAIYQFAEGLLAATQPRAESLLGPNPVPATHQMPIPSDGEGTEKLPNPTLNSVNASATESSVNPRRNVFRLEGDIWTLTFAGKTIRLKDNLGLKCIAHLIAKKRCEIDAALLRAIVNGHIPVKPAAGIEVVDSQAIERYRSDYEDLLFQRDKAQKNNDVARQEQLQTQIDALARQFASATGLGGRIRKSKDEFANARTSLTNAINRTIKRIQPKHADLARHLDNSIRTGQSFCYAPETDVAWDL